jgi:hypothetical protein
VINSKGGYDLDKKNQDIRTAIVEAGLKHWQVAAEYGLHVSNFTCLLRHELDPAKREKILAIISNLKGVNIVGHPESHHDRERSL